MRGVEVRLERQLRRRASIGASLFACGVSPGPCGGSMTGGGACLLDAISTALFALLYVNRTLREVPDW